MGEDGARNSRSQESLLWKEFGGGMGRVWHAYLQNHENMIERTHTIWLQLVSAGSASCASGFKSQIQGIRLMERILR